jgi:hypothetical protein
MTVFLPDAVVALVVIAVFDAPVFARGTPETDLIFRSDTGDEVTDVNVLNGAASRRRREEDGEAGRVRSYGRAP